MSFSINDNPNESAATTQNQKILKYLKEGNRITALEALKMFGCFRLASRISDLRHGTWKDAHGEVDIKDRFIVVPYSEKRVKEYYIQQEKEE